MVSCPDINFVGAGDKDEKLNFSSASSSTTALTFINDVFEENTKVKVELNEEYEDETIFKEIYNEQSDTEQSDNFTCSKMEIHSKTMGMEVVTSSTLPASSSLVWLYFEKIGNERAKCQLCHNTYSRKGKSTSSLKNHLRSLHKSEFKLIVDEEGKRLHQKILQKEYPCPAVKVPKQRISLTSSLLDKGTSKDIDYLISEMICLDDLAFNHVQGQGFIHFMSRTFSNYNLKGANYYSKLVCTNLYDSVLNIVKNKIENMNHKLSFTINEWCDVSRNVTLFILTCHGFTDNFERGQIVLSAAPIMGKKTVECIIDKFKETLTYWHIPVNKVHAVIRYSEPDLECALKIAKIESYDCVIHKLQLVIKSAIKAQKVIHDVVVKCQLIETYFSQSISDQDELNQQNINLYKHWLDFAALSNTTYYTLKRILEVKAPLCLFFRSNNSTSNLPQIDADEWNIIKKCIDCLDPFEQVVKKLSDHSASLSDVLPLINSLKSLYTVRNDDFDSEILALKATLRIELDCYLNTLETIQTYKIATYLDPRYKGKVFSNSDVKLQTQDDIANLCCVLSDEQENLVIANQPQMSDNTISPNKILKSGNSLQETLIALLSDSDEALVENEPKVHLKRARKEISIKDMIKEYDNLKRLDINGDALAWWNTNKSQYYLLSELAKSYLACPPTNALPCTQLISKDSSFPGPMLNRLKSINGEKVLFLKYNLPLINFEYEKRQ